MCIDKTLHIISIALGVIAIGLIAGLYGYVDVENPGYNFDPLTELLDFVNSAKYPFPYEEFARPDLGACCAGLCSGDLCYVGPEYSLDSRSCNRCCFHLVEPDSCVGSECTCYANSQ
jgi:hypothetical protein